MGAGVMPGPSSLDKETGSMPRTKGSPNKATANARKAFQSLLEGRIADLDAWIDQVAATDPAKAFAMVMDLARYTVPRPRPAAPDPVPLPPVVIRFTDAAPAIP